MVTLPYDDTALRLQLADHEGVRTLLYDDVTGRPLVKGDTLQGSITGGIGHNFSVNPLSHDLIELLLDRDLAEVQRQLLNRLPWIVRLPDRVIRAILDLAFHYGVAGLIDNQAAMIHDIERGCYHCAAQRLKESSYMKAFPKRATDLVALLEI